MLSRPAETSPYLSPPTLSTPRLAAIMALGAVVLGLGLTVAPSGVLTMVASAVGASVLLAGLGLALVASMRGRSGRAAVDLLEAFIAKDASPSFVTDEDGMIQSRNLSAHARFDTGEQDTLASALRTLLANPTAILYRLQRKCLLDGAAREDIVTRAGHVRLSVHKVGDDGFLWRVEDMPDQRGQTRGDNLPIPMITVGRNGAILFMNEAARTLAGQRAKTLDRLFDTLPLQSGSANVMATSEGPVDVIVAERETNAGRREIYVLPSEGGVEADSSVVFETLPVPLIKLTQDGRIDSANRMALGLLSTGGQKPDTLDDVMTALGRSIPDWISDTITRHPVPQAEVLRLNRKDQEMFVQVSLSRVVEAGQSVLIGVLNDATELKTLEAQFVQSQKMQAIGQLAGGVAHDFNNLLTAISGHCDLLLLRHDQGDPDYGDLIQINQNANRAAALVGQLLAFSRKQTLRPEVIDLRDTLADLTHLLNRLVGEKVLLTLSHDPVLRPIRADKRQLEQVLMNLVVNARDAMPDGGEIRIETEDTTLTEPIERDRARVPVGDYVVVRVRDEGVGIQPDKLSKVFEPFYTTKRTGEGTGLGLSTAYGIVKQTGGFIFVDSALGSGTCFTIYLPVNDAKPETAAPVPETAPVQAPVHGEGVVLLVEDEAPVRAFASRALRLRGYTVIEADSAEDALETLEDPALSVDIFITDVVMPGMDGPSWVRKALETRPDVRVVFVSGYTEGALTGTDEEIPNSVFLPKPFSLTQLTETVHRQLH